jgi:hypothetical protein
VPGYRFRRREYRDGRPRRPVSALWLLFWLILIIILLGLLFGGYRKGSKMGGEWVPAGHGVTISSLSLSSRS